MSRPSSVRIHPSADVSDRAIIGERSSIWNQAQVRERATIGEDCVVESKTSIDGAVLDRKVTVGPFARLRPGTRLADKVRIGNFVETKKAVLGVGSKANHLAYLGDTTMGDDCNIGAGTITCNYDGVNKHRTVIGDDAFIGSDTQLVAPVTVGAGATLGAGTTLARDAPAGKLTVSRARQVTLEHWKRPQRAAPKD